MPTGTREGRQPGAMDAREPPGEDFPAASLGDNACSLAVASVRGPLGELCSYRRGCRDPTAVTALAQASLKTTFPRVLELGPLIAGGTAQFTLEGYRFDILQSMDLPFFSPDVPIRYRAR